MGRRSDRRKIEAARVKKQKEAHFLFLGMQAKPYLKRRELARRLMKRTDLKEHARKDGMTMKALREEGVVQGRF